MNEAGGEDGDDGGVLFKWSRHRDGVGPEEAGNEYSTNPTTEMGADDILNFHILYWINGQ